MSASLACVSLSEDSKEEVAEAEEAEEESESAAEAATTSGVLEFDDGCRRRRQRVGRARSRGVDCVLAVLLPTLEIEHIAAWRLAEAGKRSIALKSRNL